jgi:hypothetical protein
VSPILQAPYGLWRNETTTILNTATNNFLEGTNYNYSCKLSNKPGVRSRYVLQDPTMVNSLPTLVQCNILIQIPFVFVLQFILLKILKTEESVFAQIQLLNTVLLESKILQNLHSILL